MAAAERDIKAYILPSEWSRQIELDRRPEDVLGPCPPWFNGECRDDPDKDDQGRDPEENECDANAALCAISRRAKALISRVHKVIHGMTHVFP
jgi:hypothetical protein